MQKFTVLPLDFSIEGGELTPTMKIRRKNVYEKYKMQIDLMYQDAKI